MTSIGEYNKLLRRSGISLAAPNNREIALTRDDALTAVQILKNANLAILGGDVYLRHDAKIQGAVGSGWYVKQEPQESSQAYRIRSFDLADDYIRKHPSSGQHQVLFSMAIYPRWWDYVWLAADRDGHIGAFATGGAGPLPISLLTSQSMFINDIEPAILELPLISKAILLVEFPDPDSFVGLAQRGFFVYDWSDVHATSRRTNLYEKVAFPDEAINVDALPGRLENVAKEFVLLTSSFVTDSKLDVTIEFDCLRSNC